MTLDLTSFEKALTSLKAAAFEKKMTTKEITLEENNLEIIKQIFNDTAKDLNIQVYMYGSRAKGTAWKYSDIDLALLSSTGKIPISVISKLSLDFEESLLPYKVDIIDLYTVSENFKKAIETDLIKL
jgi:predicted nucleotidyltransferase